jgi:hypothetical protein
LPVWRGRPGVAILTGILSTAARLRAAFEAGWDAVRSH